jgi:hypothetical protein
MKGAVLRRMRKMRGYIKMRVPTRRGVAPQGIAIQAKVVPSTWAQMGIL